MRYERLPLWWLPVYILTCGLGGAFLASGATYWNVEAGLYAGIAGVVFGVLGWLFMGGRIPNPTLDALAREQGRGDNLMDMGLRWKLRADEARALLIRARRYVGSAPLEGSLTLEQDIEAFLYRASIRGEE